MFIPKSLEESEIWQEAAMNLSQAKPTPKQLNLNKLSDAGGSQIHWSVQKVMTKRRCPIHWSNTTPDLSFLYVADVVFEEDASLANTGHAAENMGLLRRITMNIIKTIDPLRGMADARRSAAYENAYLRGILSRLFMGKC